MIERLQLNENAYFFTRNNTATFTRDTIKKIFKEVLVEKKDSSILHEDISVLEDTFLYSLLIFTFEEPPNFIIDTEDNDDYELKYGYILIVEFDRYVVVSRKNASGFTSLRSEIKQLDYHIISRLFVEDKSLFEKFFMRNMDISDSAIRQRAMEAINLKNSVPILTSAKYILSSMRINNSSQRYSLTFNTSRIQQVGIKRSFTELLEWISKVIEKLENFDYTESYLDYFPIPVEFEEKINEITPVSILFFTLDLVNELESGQLTKIDYQKPDGTRKEIEQSSFSDYLDSILKYRELINKSSNEKLYNLVSKEIKTKGLSDKNVLIRINTKSITIKSKKLQRVILTRNGKEINLLEYINRHNEFIINFDQPDLLYYNRKLFHDTNLIGFTKQFMDVFIAHDDWTFVNSEKGLKEEYTTDMTEFPENSLFRKIVDEYKDSKCTICDDLSTEWADFIIIDDEEIKLIHAKHNTVAMSASKFHDIVSQAQKNIGQFSSSLNEWKKRKDKWENKYKLYSIQTNINRILGSLSFEDIITTISELSLKPNLQKIICLYVTFLSKSELEHEFEEIRRTNRCNKNQVVQLLWLISSIVSSCIENNIKIYIHCLP